MGPMSICYPSKFTLKSNPGNRVTPCHLCGKRGSDRIPRMQIIANYKGIDRRKLDMAVTLSLSSGTFDQHRNINSQSIVGIKSVSAGRGG